MGRPLAPRKRRPRGDFGWRRREPRVGEEVADSTFPGGCLTGPRAAFTLSVDERGRSRCGPTGLARTIPSIRQSSELP
jgi:hypothetical protein